MPDVVKIEKPTEDNPDGFPTGSLIRIVGYMDAMVLTYLCTHDTHINYFFASDTTI